MAGGAGDGARIAPTAFTLGDRPVRPLTADDPEGALLVIEVAVSSLAIDTQIKPALYAAAGVPDHWGSTSPRSACRCSASRAATGMGRAP